jgi:hypothetical protein
VAGEVATLDRELRACQFAEELSDKPGSNEHAALCDPLERRVEPLLRHARRSSSAASRCSYGSAWGIRSCSSAGSDRAPDLPARAFLINNMLASDPDPQGTG